MPETDREYKKWQTSSRKDAKGLSKALPGTARKLRGGELDADTFALGAAREQHRVRTPDWSPSMDELFVYGLSARLVRSDVALRTRLCDELITEIQETRSPQQLLEELAHGKTDLEGMLESANRTMKCTSAAVDEVLTSWESTIMRVNDKRPLKSLYPAYKSSLEDFQKFFHDTINQTADIDLDKRLDESMSRLRESRSEYHGAKEAAQGVVDGHDVIRSTCWECGKHDRRNVQPCSVCKAARYCGRECQGKAWKTGHRQGCSALKGVYASFRADLDRVDKALEDGVVVKDGSNACWLKPNPAFDYTFVTSLMSFRHGLLPKLQNFPTHEMKPAMDTLYQQLDVISRSRSHWVFSDTRSDGFLKKIKGMQLGGAGPVEDDEQQIMFTLVPWLMGIDPNVLPPPYMRTFRTQMGAVAVRGSGVNDLITSKRFLECYVSTREDLEKIKEFRYGCLTRALTSFRENYHKVGN